jgi:hypothetical protein
MNEYGTILTGNNKKKVFGEKSIPVPVCSPKIPHGLPSV